MGAASVAAHRGGKWQGVYSASKFAVCGLSPSVAQELAEHQITPDHRQRLRPRRGAHGDGGLDRRRHGLAERHRAGSEMAAMVAAIPLGRQETRRTLPE